MRQSGMSRRGLLRASLLGSGVLAGCSTAPGGSSFEAAPPLVPIRARTDRIFDITVCLRPFRAPGRASTPSALGDTLVVHNYGHGGSGWSLSWGSSARRGAHGHGRPVRGEIAVIGCGVLGLTSAILAQRAGARVTIYARDLLPRTRRRGPPANWTPDSRIALAECRRTGLRRRVGGDGAHVLQDAPRLPRPAGHAGGMDRPILGFRRHAAHRASGAASGRRAGACPSTSPATATASRDLVPNGAGVPAEPRRSSATSVARSEMHDLQHRRLRPHPDERLLHRRRPVPSAPSSMRPREIAALGKKVVINCTGYGARALWKDETHHAGARPDRAG